MALMKSAPKKDMEADMKEGKAPKQSLAIAYSIKRQNARKKMALGGAVDSTPKTPISTMEDKADAMHAHTDECWVDGACKYALGGAVDSTPKTSISPMEDKMQTDEDMSPAEMADYHARMSEHYAMLAEGGEVDLNANSEESPNMEDQYSFEANGKEQYDLDQLSKQPMDSNEDGDEEEKDSENKHDRIAEMRKKVKAKRAM